MSVCVSENDESSKIPFLKFLFLTQKRQKYLEKREISQIFCMI